MKTAFIVPARDKAHGVAACVKSVLAQSYYPMELIFSDQGSTDDTRGIIEATCKSYGGANKVRIVDCPDTEPHGMAGFNAHVNWIATQTDADILIVTSADDINDIERAAKVVEKFNETGAAMVNNSIQFMQMDGESGATPFPHESRFVTGAEVIHNMVGGSSAMALSHEFMDKVGGFPGSVCTDVYMPYLATQDRGLYYIRDLLYCLIRWIDPKNTGLGGRQLAAKTEDEKIVLQEMVQYQISATYTAIYRACERLYAGVWNEDDRQMLMNYMIGTTNAWSDVRNILTDKRIQPGRLAA